MSLIRALTRTRDQRAMHITDWLTYGFLLLGVVLMFGPALWLAASSLKTKSALQEFPPSFLPMGQKEIKLADKPDGLPVYLVPNGAGQSVELALQRRIGLIGLFIDPAKPDADPVRAKIDEVKPVRELTVAWDNYAEPLRRFRFDRFLGNSLFVTIVSTVLTLLVNSMCAFALSKYSFRGRDAMFVFILSTLMVPISVILIPAFLVVTSLGLTNSLWGVILPPIATPTGVFLLRQYMLTIPDELIDAARMDGASEWRVYWRIIMPLAMPMPTRPAAPVFSPADWMPCAMLACRLELPRAPASASARCTVFSSSRGVASYSMETIATLTISRPRPERH
jgi:alpha-1,4-digalacturonate transport system permease protein